MSAEGAAAGTEDAGGVIATVADPTDVFVLDGAGPGCGPARLQLASTISNVTERRIVKKALLMTSPDPRLASRRPSPGDNRPRRHPRTTLHGVVFRP